MDDTNVVNVPVRRATAQDLEMSRPLIEQLYKQKTLPEVMEIMESEHGLIATENMYKKRINKWGLDKKNKEKEMKAVVRKEKQRTLIGKGSIFRVRGRRLEYKDVVRYWKRRQLSIQDVLALSSSRDATPDALECATPVPSQVSLPVELATPERILKCISDYYHSSFESGTWYSTDPAFGCRSIKALGTAMGKKLARLKSQTVGAANLFNQGKFHEAGQTLISGTAVIKEVLLAENHMTLPFVFQLLTILHRLPCQEIGMAIMRQIIALGEAILCQQHPLPQIIASLASLDHYQISHSTERAWRSIGDYFESQLGFIHASTLDIRRRYYYTLADDTALRGVLKESEILLGAQDPRCKKIRTKLASLCLDNGQYAEAEREALSVFEPQQKMDVDSAALVSEASIILSMVYFSQGNINAGEAYGRPTNSSMDGIFRVSLLDAGRRESAQEIEQWRLTILAAETRELQEAETRKLQETEGYVLGSRISSVALKG